MKIKPLFFAVNVVGAMLLNMESYGAAAGESAPPIGLKAGPSLRFDELPSSLSVGHVLRETSSPDKEQRYFVPMGDCRPVKGFEVVKGSFSWSPYALEERRHVSGGFGPGIYVKPDTLVQTVGGVAVLAVVLPATWVCDGIDAVKRSIYGRPPKLTP